MSTWDEIKDATLAFCVIVPAATLIASGLVLLVLWIIGK